MKTKKNDGFTLIEVMVALFIFAIVATLAVTGLRNVLLTHEIAEQHVEELAQLQMALLLMQRDIEQAMNRPIVDQSGGQLASFIGNAQSIEFTHGGYINPQAIEDRSSLQRVAYSIENHQLVRIVWPVLDRTPSTVPTKRILLNNINELSFHFIDKEHNIQNNWPPIQASQTTALPAAVKLDMIFKQQGHLERFFMISGQG